MKPVSFRARQILSLFLIFTLLISSLALFTSCREVYMTLGGQEVPYDMVRCLVKQQVSAYTEEELQEEALREKIRETVLSDLRNHYAVYAVAEELGLSLTSYDKDIIEETMDMYRSLEEYDAMLEATFSTDEIIQDIETVTYLEDRVFDYLCENNDRFKSDVDTVDADLAGGRWYAAEYVILLYDDVNHDYRGGEMETVREEILAGKSLREASSSLQTRYASEYYYVIDGCFTDTIYPNDFEETVKDLEVGEVSEVLDTMTSDGYACYMLLRRVPLDRTYIEEHYNTVIANYLSRVFTEYMQEKAASLEMVLAEDYLSSDLLDIE